MALLILGKNETVVQFHLEALDAFVAQLAVRLSCKQEVASSTLAEGSTYREMQWTH
jgi:hypothetical protein